MPSLIARLLLWLAPTFLLWSWLVPKADPLVAPLVSAALGLVGPLKPAYETSGSALLFSLSSASMTFEVSVDSRLYTWGLPLAIALLLAARSPIKPWTPVSLVAIALCTAIWGVLFDVLSQLLRDAPFALLPMTSLKANGIAMGYQLGSLIFPGVLPLAVAVALSWKEITLASSKTNQFG